MLAYSTPLFQLHRQLSSSGNIIIFRDVKTWGLLDIYQCFGGTWCTHLGVEEQVTRNKTVSDIEASQDFILYPPPTGSPIAHPYVTDHFYFLMYVVYTKTHFETDPRFWRIYTFCVFLSKKK
jgi:hypothetical protein